jgi:ubiquinone/menaquinone biosynthesis C-methylase UbiE
MLKCSSFSIHRSSISSMPLDVKKTWNACGEAFDRFTTAADSFSENIERPAVEQLIGDVTGLRLLDLGCGSGTFSVWFALRGALVTALDLSQTMISLAEHRAQQQGVSAEFRVADIQEPLQFEASHFDLVFTGTALHYVENIDSLMAEVARVMKPKAKLIASILHPMSTARFALADCDEVEGPDPWEGWYFGSPLRSIETPWLEFGEVAAEGRRISCYHHTVADYFNAISSAGLTITALLEPKPSAEFASKNADRYYEAMRTPVFLIFKAEKR